MHNRGRHFERRQMRRDRRKQKKLWNRGLIGCSFCGREVDKGEAVESAGVAVYRECLARSVGASRGGVNA